VHHEYGQLTLATAGLLFHMSQSKVTGSLVSVFFSRAVLVLNLFCKCVVVFNIICRIRRRTRRMGQMYCVCGSHIAGLTLALTLVQLCSTTAAKDSFG